MSKYPKQKCKLCGQLLDHYVDRAKASGGTPVHKHFCNGRCWYKYMDLVGRN